MNKPSESELEVAAAICNDLAAYIAVTEPHATTDIGNLQEAANVLHAFAEVGGEGSDDE